MQRVINLFYLLLLGFFAPFSARAEGTSSALIKKSLATRFARLPRWKAHFTQETASVGLGRGSFSEGRFVFVKPNLFRYSLVSPEKSDFIHNGKEAWQIIYPRGATKPPHVRHFKDPSRLDLNRYLVLFRGLPTGKPADDFNVQGKSEGTDLVVEITPRKDSEILSMVLVFKNSVEAPYKAVLKDSLGNTTIITVGSFESLKKVDDSEFRPEIPKDAVIEEL